jgi:hypothetical protein
MPEFYSQHLEFIKTHSRGFGLWIWKPAILAYLIERLDDNEMVLLLDSGCQFNSTAESKVRFDEYIKLTSTNDLLLMQIANDSFGFQDLTNAAWTKLSVLDSLDPLSAFRNSNQIQSGIIFAIKSEKSVRVAKMWLDLCTRSEYSLLVDPPPHESQPIQFRQHRWEQSILSLILKSEGIPPLLDETYFYPNWSDGLNFPIWAMRNRSGGDAFRRNFLDILKLSAAKIERHALAFCRKELGTK